MEIATIGSAPRYSQRADEKTGEAVKLFAVDAPAAALTEADVIAFCRKEFTAYKVPQSARLVDVLPKSTVGSVACAVNSTHWPPRS